MNYYFNTSNRNYYRHDGYAKFLDMYSEQNKVWLMSFYPSFRKHHDIFVEVSEGEFMLEMI